MKTSFNCKRCHYHLLSELFNPNFARSSLIHQERHAACLDSLLFRSPSCGRYNLNQVSDLRSTRTVQSHGNQLAQFPEAANNGHPDDVETIGDIRLFGEHGDKPCWLWK